jgi:hypothetical protein
MRINYRGLNDICFSISFYIFYKVIFKYNNVKNTLICLQLRLILKISKIPNILKCNHFKSSISCNKSYPHKITHYSIIKSIFVLLNIIFY